MAAGEVAWGPFIVDQAGRLAPRDPAVATGLGFCWRECRVRVRLLDGRLSLRATPGRVPSTAGAGRGLREAAFATLRRLPPALPEAWRLRLRADHRIDLEAEMRLDLPATVAELLTVLTCFLLALAPYLDLLEEAGLAGTAKA